MGNWKKQPGDFQPPIRFVSAKGAAPYQRGALAPGTAHVRQKGLKARSIALRPCARKQMLAERLLMS